MAKFKKLKHSSIVLTGYEFVENNPLGFFEFDNKKDKKAFFKMKKEGKQAKGKVILSSNGFKLNNNSEENKADKDKFMIVRAKSRPVLVFQDIDFNSDFHQNCFVIPIQTLNKPDRMKCKSDIEYEYKLKLYKNIKNREKEVYNLYYIPTKTNTGEIYERMLVLSDARFVHKSTIYGQVRDNEINKEDINEISKRLGKILKIEELEKCSECKLNYENFIKQSEAYEEVAMDDIKVISFKKLRNK